MYFVTNVFFSVRTSIYRNQRKIRQNVHKLLLCKAHNKQHFHPLLKLVADPPCCSQPLGKIYQYTHYIAVPFEQIKQIVLKISKAILQVKNMVQHYLQEQPR